jgi:ferredoxin--NADP+ reductase
MTDTNIRSLAVFPTAVIGAGPAGLYAAKYLASAGMDVALINRDIKPGGLAEYGIFHSKHKMKNGLRKQFRSIMDEDEIRYYGNLVVGDAGDLSLEKLKEMGFKAVMVSVGAQGTKWLGLPGEHLQGVYHAKDLVYHYNQLPPFSNKEFKIGKHVVLIGAGNVMMDIATYCIRDLKVESVTTVVRRGPADVKFTKKEMAHVAANLDLDALQAEIDRTSPVMDKVGQDPETAHEFILSALDKAEEPVSETKFRFDFLASPREIQGDENGRVTGLVVDETTLELKDDGRSKSVKLGTTRTIEADSVIFCIGDQVEPGFGLPLDRWNEFAKHPEPEFPEEGISYEAYDPESGKTVEGVFLSGWAREASSGLVGAARKDGENGAKAMLEYLETLPVEPSVRAVKAFETLEAFLGELDKPVVAKQDLFRLEDIEIQQAEALGLESFKFSTNAEMFEAMGLTHPV